MSRSQIRKIILQQSKNAHVGHIGSSLSIADMVLAIYGKTLRAKGPDDPDRDRFILSKGHAALAVYAALRLKGWISEAEINTFCGDGTLLAVHPEYLQKGIDFTTGSLGQGLTIGAGCALAARMKGADRRAFVLLSDAECNEGSVWEAIMFAAHQQLSNLIAMVDLNKQQAFGYTRDVVNMDPMIERWRAFGWDVHDVDGHDVPGLEKIIAGLDTKRGPPHVLVCRTTFGKGVSFMENKIKWHYWPMNDEEFKTAMSEVEKLS